MQHVYSNIYNNHKLILSAIKLWKRELVWFRTLTPVAVSKYKSNASCWESKFVVIILERHDITCNQTPYLQARQSNRKERLLLANR